MAIFPPTSARRTAGTTGQFGIPHFVERLALITLQIGDIATFLHPPKMIGLTGGVGRAPINTSSTPMTLQFLTELEIPMEVKDIHTEKLDIHTEQTKMRGKDRHGDALIAN